jgi:hypothetical protein
MSTPARHEFLEQALEKMPREILEKQCRPAWPRAFKSFWHRPAYLVSDSPYRVYRAASE